MKRPANSDIQHEKKRAKVKKDACEVVAKVVNDIPAGQTRSKMEVFRASLIELSRGDEGIDTGVRTVLGGHLRSLLKCRASGWHRVVNADGDLWDEPRAAIEQLAKLRAEGARPRSNESIVAWASRVHAPLVGCYKAARGRCYTTPESATSWPTTAVEPLASRKIVQERFRLSGGKLFRAIGESRPTSPVFQADRSRKAVSVDTFRAARTLVAPRVTSAMTSGVIKELLLNGVMCLKSFFRRDECNGLRAYAAQANFADVVRLDGEAGQIGSYHFCDRAPPLVQALRESLYAVLVQSLPGLDKFGGKLEVLEKKCHNAGQKRCATIFLSFGEGGLNLAHQDPYGTLFFPYQAMIMLSRRGQEFVGGEFFVKNVRTGKAVDVAADEGDVTIFAANSAAISGADFKHGVRPVRKGTKGCCERFSIGVVFNTRK